MKNISLFISFAAVLSFNLNLFAGDSSQLSIKQAMDLALKNNPEIHSAQQMLESAAHNASAAKGRYLPRIDVLALASKINDPIMLDLNDIRSSIIGASAASYAGAGGADPSAFRSGLESSIPSFEKEVLNDTFVRVMATVVQPIFTGFKVSANAQVKKQEKFVSEINFQNAKNSVLTSVIEDYYRVKLANKVIEIRKDLQSNIEGHVSNARQLFDNGMISKANLLRAEVALADAKKDYQKSTMDKELAVILLNNTLGINTNNLTLTDTMEMLPNNYDEVYFTEKAAQNNNTVKLLESKKIMLKQKHKTAVGNLLPNIAAVGEYQILQDKLTMVEPEWAVGLTASINVFGGGSDINEINASKAEIAAVDAQIANVKNLIYTAVKKFHHQCETAKKDYEALESNKALAEENLKLYHMSFKEGLATSLEVVDAELALTKIKIDQAKAVFDYNSAYANLLSICSMSEEEFNSLNN